MTNAKKYIALFYNPDHGIYHHDMGLDWGSKPYTKEGAEASAKDFCPEGHQFIAVVEEFRNNV